MRFLQQSDAAPLLACLEWRSVNSQGQDPIELRVAGFAEQRQLFIFRMFPNPAHKCLLRLLVEDLDLVVGFLI